MTRCQDCGAFHNNGDAHVCVSYDDAHPCPTCGEGTVYVFIAAPGTGQGRTCRNNHFQGTCRELTPEEVV